MSKKEASPIPFEQTAYQRAELAAFQRMLSISEGTFSLSVAVCNSPALRDHIVAHITQELEGIKVIRIASDTLDIFDFVQHRIDDGAPRAVFVANIEEALGDENRNRVLQGLNVSRESWKFRFQCPVVLWLPEYAFTLLAAQARDLWSWVSHNFEFVSEQATALAGTKDVYAGKTSMAGNLDVHEKRFRIAELEQRLADIGDLPKRQLTEHALVWLNELAYLHHSLGDLDKAEKMLNQALEIHEKLGRLEGMASQYGNLGLIHRTRGDLDQAEKMLNQALEIHEKLGLLEGMASDYGNLGLIYLTRGDLDQAEKMLNQALEIHEKLGLLEGMANQYGNLGLIYKQRGDIAKAREYWGKALDLFQKIGMGPEVAKVQGLIDGLAKE
jgi:tetratricopeptide (TPR) repeat protein